jgi:hypothetical protein
MKDCSVLSAVDSVSLEHAIYFFPQPSSLSKIYKQLQRARVMRDSLQC